MVPRGRKSIHPHPTQPSHAVKDAIDTTKFYEDYVPEEDKARMTDWRMKFHQIREFHDDEEVEAQVGSFIPDLGCTRTHNSKFYRTLELYWHTKTMVAMGMLPKEQDFQQLKSIQEALEVQNAYLTKWSPGLPDVKGETLSLLQGATRVPRPQMHCSSKGDYGPHHPSGSE
jgi:hypothetical protein